MNIAGLVVVVAIFAVIYILVWGSDTPTLTRKDALAIVGGFITLTLGFIFGRSSN